MKPPSPTKSVIDTHRLWMSPGVKGGGEVLLKKRWPSGRCRCKGWAGRWQMVWFSEDKLGNTEDDRQAGVVKGFCPGETKSFFYLNLG